MKKQSYLNLLALVLCALPLMTWAQGKIAVQSGSTVTYFNQDALQAALDAAQNGDVVYLPGGTFDGPFTLDRSIQLIGAGYFPDSSADTTPTTITGYFYLTSSVSGSYVSGINFTGNVYSVNGTFATITGMVFHRCYVQGSFGSNSIYGFNNLSSNWVFNECFLRSLSANNARNVILRNCVVETFVENLRGGVIQNSVFLYLNTSPGIFYNCSNCTIQGNVFYGTSAGIRGASASYASVSNNCFVDATPTFTYVTSHNNTTGVAAAQLFVNNTNNTYEHSDDFHLAPGSPAIGVGPNGTDCGIYGGLSPWKEGGVPYNPHIQEQFIGTATNLQGELPVQIKVAAQGN
jgi:parallel beta-helix repeat protein